MKNNIKNLFDINSKFITNKSNLYYLILFIFFILRIYYIFKFPIREDELSHLRYASNIANGYTPFYDFIEIYLPLFNIILIPFIKIFKYNYNIVFYVRLFMLIYFYIGIFFYFKFLIKYFNLSNAKITIFLFTGSLVLFSENMEIRQFHLSFPTFVFFLYYFIENKITSKTKALLFGFILFIILSIDHRSIVFILSFLFFVEKYKILKRQIMYISFLSLIFTFILFIFLYDSKIPMALFNVVKAASGKTELVEPYNFKLLITDFQFLFLPLIIIYNFFNHKRCLILTSDNNILLFLSIFFLIVSKRIDALYVYILPFLSFKLSELYIFLIRPKFNYKLINYTASIILLFNFVINAEIKKKSFNKLLENEIKTMKEINHKVKIGYKVLNLSRYQFDIFGNNISPFPMQIEEDVTNTLKKLNLFKYLNNEILDIIENRNYEYILFNKFDNYLNTKIKNYIENNYHEISFYLYQKNTLNISSSIPDSSFINDNIIKSSNFLTKLSLKKEYNL